MTHRPARLRRPGTGPALALALALALSACAGSPSTRYFTVAAASGSSPAPAHYAGPPVEVRQVQVPPAFDRLEMVRERGPGQLEVLDFDHWAAPLGRLARQALTEDLAARLASGQVVVPGAAWPGPRAVLTVDILSFANRDGSAVMSLSWTLQPPADRAGPALASTLQLRTPAGAGAAADARAWSELMGQLADRIAERLAAGT